MALPGAADRGAGVGGSSIPSLKEKLDRIFYPKVVAVVGAKQLNNYNWLRAQGTVQGKVYNVNIDRNEWPGAEALGFQCFPSLLDIPEPVDYVVVTVPNKVAPAVLRDCITKQVGGVHFFTAGFSETGDSENIRLEEDMARMAREAGLPVIGPNCMGLFHPKVGLRQTPDQWTGEGGSVGYISQSGTQAQGFSLAAHAHGLGISKSISFGNGTVLDVTDYLEYLAQDEDTKLIGMYLEGVRDGRRFFETLRAVADEKPVLVWKVGRTEAAARATQSHTASVAISHMLWRAMVRQPGLRVSRAAPVWRGRDQQRRRDAGHPAGPALAAASHRGGRRAHRHFGRTCFRDDPDVLLRRMAGAGVDSCVYRDDR